MSLFIQLYDKIAPIAHNDKAAMDLANVLTDALAGKFEDYATKRDIAELKAEMRSEFLKQTWTIIGSLGLLGALFRFLPGK